MINELTATFNTFKQSAMKLGTYEKISITELADKFCEATDKNDPIRDSYFSALVLRFWHKISKLHLQMQTLKISKLDCYDGLVSAIIMACEPENRVWQKNPSLNAQQVINRILSSRFKAQAFYESNLLKNKGEHLVVSLDAPISASDETSSLGELIEDETVARPDEIDETVSWVQDYLNKNKIVEAIILDTIAHRDVYRQQKKTIKETDEDGNKTKYTQYSYKFWKYKLIKELNELNENYAKYFLSTYSVSKDFFDIAMTALSKANNQKKYKMVHATLTRFAPYLNKLRAE